MQLTAAQQQRADADEEHLHRMQQARDQTPPPQELPAPPESPQHGQAEGVQAVQAASSFERQPVGAAEGDAASPTLRPALPHAGNAFGGRDKAGVTAQAAEAQRLATPGSGGSSRGSSRNSEGAAFGVQLGNRDASCVTPLGEVHSVCCVFFLYAANFGGFLSSQPCAQERDH